LLDAAIQLASTSWQYRTRAIQLAKREGIMITGPQCRAGRALVEISRTWLASRSGVDEVVIEHFERKIEEPELSVVADLEAALQDLGAVFIRENSGGLGVRLKFTSSDARQIARLEDEGGVVAGDWVP
jgi:hypothetical protein